MINIYMFLVVLIGILLFMTIKITISSRENYANEGVEMVERNLYNLYNIHPDDIVPEYYDKLIFKQNNLPGD